LIGESQKSEVGPMTGVIHSVMYIIQNATAVHPMKACEFKKELKRKQNKKDKKLKGKSTVLGDIFFVMVISGK